MRVAYVISRSANNSVYIVDPLACVSAAIGKNCPVVPQFLLPSYQFRIDRQLNPALESRDTHVYAHLGEDPGEIHA